jgi:hypothetical protein
MRSEAPQPPEVGERGAAFRAGVIAVPIEVMEETIEVVEGDGWRRSSGVTCELSGQRKLENRNALTHNVRRVEMSKLLLFPKPKPAPAPIHTVEQIITISIGSEKYAMTIQAKIERVTAPPMDKPSPDFLCDRKLELRKLVPTPLRGDADADRTSGTADGSAAEATTTRAKSETLQSNTRKAPAPVATVGAPVTDVASRAGKASKKATRSEKPATSEPPGQGCAPEWQDRTGARDEEAPRLHRWDPHQKAGLEVGELTSHRDVACQSHE